MTESTPEPSQFNWILPLSAALIVTALYLAMAFSSNAWLFFATLLLVVPALILVSIALIAFAVLVRKGRQRRLTLLCTVVVLWVTATGMFWFDGKYDFAMRTNARWLIWSRHYKAEVLAQPRPMDGNLKHIEWDNWGFVPTGFTTAYLVLDPSDSLSAAANKQPTGKLDGIPCAVFDVKRLEKNWYAVVFYTDEDWSHCN